MDVHLADEAIAAHFRVSVRTVQRKVHDRLVEQRRVVGAYATARC